MTSPVDVAFLARLLGQPEDSRLRALYRNAIAPSAKLTGALLTAAKKDGRRLGAMGESQLEMLRERTATYTATATRLRRLVPSSVVLKGGEIARYYPEWLPRDCVDLDLYVPSAEDAWQVAAHVLAEHEDISEANVSVIDRDDGHDVFIGLTWPSPYSDLDSIYRVEISTVPHLGDGKTVPPRPGLFGSAALRQLLLVAEEQFQRAICARDLLDTLFLVTALDDSPQWIDPVRAARLAPELTALLTAAEEVAATTQRATIRRFIDSLADITEREIARRESSAGVDLRIRYGLPLDGPPADTARFVEHDFGRLLWCPLGTYLMVTDLAVPEDVYHAASAAAVPRG